MTPEIALLWDRIRDISDRYKPGAFSLVQEGLRHTVERLAQEEDRSPGESRHVTGQELCLGLRDYAIGEFGLLARAVLENLGVRRTEDFGRIVFILVEAGLMRKTDEDSIDDFTCVYDFDEAFGSPLSSVV